MKSDILNVNLNPKQQVRKNMNSQNMIKSHDNVSLGKSWAY